MAEWTSPSQQKSKYPPRQRVKQLKEKFETPQVRAGAQRTSPKREKVPELRKKFEHSHHHGAGASGHSHDHSGKTGSEPHHDETEYVDILKTIVHHHQEDLASLQSEIEELQELVDDLSSDRLSVSGGSLGMNPSGQGTFTSTPEKRGTYKAPAREGTYRAPARKGTYKAPAREGTYKAPAREGTYTAPAREGTYTAPAREGTYTAPAREGTYTAPAREGTYTAPAREGTYTAPARKGTYTTQPTTGDASTSRRGTYTKPSKRSYTDSETDRIIFENDYEDYYDPDNTHPWQYMPPGRNEEELEDDVFYPGVSPKAFKKQFPRVAAQHEYVKTGRLHSEPTEVLNHPGYTKKRQEKSEPIRKKEEKHPWPFRGRDYKKGKHTAGPTGKGTYAVDPSGKGTYAVGPSGKGTYAVGPSGKGTYVAGPTGKGTYAAGPTKKGTYTAEPSRKSTYTAEPSRKGTYTAEPSRKGTYTAEPSRKGTYTAEPSRKGTYTAESSRKGTYTAEPSRKGTYTAEPSRKGTYTATPSSRGAKNKPINDGTAKVDPFTPHISRAPRFGYTNKKVKYLNRPPGAAFGGSGSNQIQKTVTLRSPGKDENVEFDINVEPREISESASGEHVVCDIDIELQAKKPTGHWHSTPPVTPSRQRKPSIGTPKSVFTKYHHSQRNLFDAEPESPEYRSPKDTTIEWEDQEESQNSPKNRTFEINPSTSQMNRTFTTNQKNEFEDESFQGEIEHDGTFEESPHDRGFLDSTYNGAEGGHHDRTFEDSPQWKQKDNSHSPHNDRTFEDSPQWKQKDSSHSPHNDRTFEDSPQWKQKDSSQSPRHDRTFQESPQWANRTYEVSEDEEILESPQLNKTFDA